MLFITVDDTNTNVSIDQKINIIIFGLHEIDDILNYILIIYKCLK